MSEVVNALVAAAVIVLIFKWITASPKDPAQAALGFRPRKVTDDMVDRVADVYPDIPRDNIRYDLLRTGDVVVTSEKILTRGFLDAPPTAYYTIYPRQTGASAPAPTPASTSARASVPATASASTSSAKPASLIERYKLEQRLSETSAGAQDESSAAAVGGQAKWEDTAGQREASLQERKAQMILAARQRFLAQQQASASGSGAP